MVEQAHLLAAKQERYAEDRDRVKAVKELREDAMRRDAIRLNRQRKMESEAKEDIELEKQEQLAKIRETAAAEKKTFAEIKKRTESEDAQHIEVCIRR
jgi:hypothetical protein